MRTSTAAIALVLGAVACGGFTPPPKTLSDAKAEFMRAKDGPAGQYDPTGVHEAELALQKAEAAWNASQDYGDDHVMQLAIIAQRRAEIAEAEGAAAKAQKDLQQAKADLEVTMRTQLQATRQALTQTQTQLTQTAAQAAEQKKQLADLEARLKDARETIAKIAAVKDDDRGLIITLQGEVLFKTGAWELKPAAMAKLDQIADALRGKEQPMVVHGFTDNVGTFETNMELSQKRAQSVRDYLASKGIPQDLITAQGRGPDAPIADNGSADGRAQNRRVEIIVKPKK